MAARTKPKTPREAKEALWAQRDEIFAQLVASGVAGWIAWRESGKQVGAPGSKPNSLIAAAARKREEPHVAARILELQNITARKYDLKREDAISYLVQILKTPIGDIDDKHPLCEGKRYGKMGMSYWMPSKLGAMELLCRMMPGWLAPVKGEISATPEAIEMLKALRNGEELPASAKAIDVTPRVYWPEAKKC